MLTGRLQGWFAARHELQLPMFIFLVLSILYLAGWGVMFFSTTFRWTFTTWCFFAMMASASVFLTLMATILGIVCRCNFGKGLVHYRESFSPWIGSPGNDFILAVNTNQPYEEDAMSTDIEKVPFTAPEKPLPAFAFVRKHGDGSATNLGPKSSTVDLVTFLKSTLQRDSDDAKTHGPQRSTSSGSSGSSGKSSYHSRDASDHYGQRQRWIIE
jgi:hypothetical protein